MRAARRATTPRPQASLDGQAGSGERGRPCSEESLGIADGRPVRVLALPSRGPVFLGIRLPVTHARCRAEPSLPLLRDDRLAVDRLALRDPFALPTAATATADCGDAAVDA